MTRMGIEITQWDATGMVGTMPVKGNRQPYGLLHGGANAVLAETLGSVAAAMHAAPDRLIALGLELSCTHHRAALDGHRHRRVHAHPPGPQHVHVRDRRSPTRPASAPAPPA